jgi:hypothetical protein
MYSILLFPMSLLQKHMKPHCVPYILYRDIGHGTLCSTALSIGVVSARGSHKCAEQYNVGSFVGL